jgi:protein gp37
MATQSRIEWTQNTWNPVTGCTKITAGCRNCYAERMARRLQAMKLSRYQKGFEVNVHEDLISLPTRWKQPRLIFVNSMSDLFHEHVPDDFIRRVFDTMAKSPQHIFQILTKRSSRLVNIASSLTWTPNIWIGVTVEDGNYLYRINDLVRVPAKIRFLSCEPLIGPIAYLPLDGVQWVIVGGESGPGARPMERDWVDEIQLQCERAQIPFFFKQWGGVRKKQSGRLLNGRTYDDLPLNSHFIDNLFSPLAT